MSSVKTKMCKSFLNGWCPYGEKCMFAHNEKEINRLCFYVTKEKCTRYNCTYEHQSYKENKQCYYVTKEKCTRYNCTYEHVQEKSIDQERSDKKEKVWNKKEEKKEENSATHRASAKAHERSDISDKSVAQERSDKIDINKYKDVDKNILYYKTKPCEKFLKNEQCKVSYCSFYHSISEKRTIEQNIEKYIEDQKNKKDIPKFIVELDESDDELNESMQSCSEDDKCVSSATHGAKGDKEEEANEEMEDLSEEFNKVMLEQKEIDRAPSPQYMNIRQYISKNLFKSEGYGAPKETEVGYINLVCNSKDLEKIMKILEELNI